MTLTITLIGASTFLISEILKNKGYSQLSKSILPLTTGVGTIIVLWKITKLFI